MGDVCFGTVLPFSGTYLQLMGFLSRKQSVIKTWQGAGVMPAEDRRLTAARGPLSGRLLGVGETTNLSPFLAR